MKIGELLYFYWCSVGSAVMFNWILLASMAEKGML